MHTHTHVRTQVQMYTYYLLVKVKFLLLSTTHFTFLHFLPSCLRSESISTYCRPPPLRSIFPPDIFFAALEMVQEVNFLFLFFTCGLCASSSVAFQALSTLQADHIQPHCAHCSVASEATKDTLLTHGRDVVRGFHLKAVFLFPST